ncbi:MAG: hypothetical protein J6P60_04450 [Lachnospiraceae bacterium]|nr:hypothetical protein [Lachnospiraceae bacterium]
MAISPIEFQGIINRTQDMTMLQHNEEHKGILHQAQFQVETEKNAQHNLNQVRQSDETEPKKDQSDAREKGNGIYMGDGGKNRKKKEGDPAGGKVVRKDSSHFDVSI